MVSFYSQSASAEFIATTLDQGYGIMARSGFHCAHPMFRHRGLPEVVRASTYLYNNESEIELLVEALGEIVRLL